MKRQRIIVQGQLQQRVVNPNNTVIYTIPSNSQQPIRVLTTQNSQYAQQNNNMTHNYSNNVNPATGNYDVLNYFSLIVK